MLQNDEIKLFFKNIEYTSDRLYKLLERRGENELQYLLKNLSDSAFINLNEISLKNGIVINKDLLIKEIALVNKIFSKFNQQIGNIIIVLKVALNSLKDFVSEELKNALIIIDELLDLISYLWKKFRNNNRN
jgi:hypothetical protein